MNIHPRVVTNFIHEQFQYFLIHTGFEYKLYEEQIGSDEHILVDPKKYTQLLMEQIEKNKVDFDEYIKRSEKTTLDVIENYIINQNMKIGTILKMTQLIKSTIITVLLIIIILMVTNIVLVINR